MRRTPVSMVAVLVGTVVAALGIVPAAAGAALAAGANPAARVAKSIVVSVSSDYVKPKVKLDITATLTPREPGRMVLLRLSTGKRYRNVASAITNAKGVATFSHAFGTVGTLHLRAQAIATGLEPVILSKVVDEQVVSVLPFILPGGTELKPGSTGALVADLQQRLTNLGYWLGGAGGYFGEVTEQAVYAMEKVAGITRSGVVDPQFVAALNADTVPVPKTKTGDAIEVNLERDYIMFVHNGQLEHVLNTSTGGGYTYTQDGTTNVALTPRGYFHTNRIVDGLVTDTLGQLWRPRFFVAGYAIHGDSYVPPFPESHGCVRVSNEAIDWIWANNLDPIGMPVWVY